MPTQYPILDNRPIDQWKVTELREELRRRKLTAKGLKEELVRRLDVALRDEMEAMQEEELGNGFDPNTDAQGNDDKEGTDPPEENNIESSEDKSKKVDNDDAMVDVSDKNLDVNQGMQSMVDVNDKNLDVNQGIQEQGQNETGGTSVDAVVEETTISAVPVEDNVTDNQNVVTESRPSKEETRHVETTEKSEDPKPPVEDAMLTQSETNNQVSEVSPDLGFQVKCESISTDSVSINEKNELKDNLNANNVHLELEVVKPEMVQPSSSDVPTIGGDMHPLDDDKELVDNQGSLEEIGDVICATDVELSKRNDSAEGGSPEKLNLDRSSGDESMEEDVLESKPIESKNSDEVGEREEDHNADVAQVGKPIDAVVDGFSPEKKDATAEESLKPTLQIEKRKAEEQEVVGINEPKRRRWNSETIKAPEQPTSNLTVTTPKDVFQPAPKRSFARSDSSLSGDTPKERIVPLSQKTPTTSLRIDHFLRPFTLKAVQELLAKTGTVSDFWMDHIKTHCYVTYSSIEEAIATRDAVYNLQWPPNGGRLLAAEFVDPQEVKMRVEAPPPSPVPVTPSPTTPTAPPLQHQPQAPPPPRQHSLRQQQLPPPPPLPPPPALSNPPPVRERLQLSPPPQKKPDPPIVTLDDLFKKTRATPRIYYLPLSEEQVAAKLAAQGKRAVEQ